MSDINKLIVSGHLVWDPEIRETSKGLLVKLIIGINETWYVGDVLKHRTEWQKIEVWGDLAASCVNYKKGYNIYAEGPIKTHAWTDTDGHLQRDKILKATQVSFWGYGKKNLPGPEVDPLSAPYEFSEESEQKAARDE